MSKLTKSLLLFATTVALSLSLTQQAFANRDVEFYGVVNSMPSGLYGAWVVGERTVNVTPATRIEQDHGPIAVGSFVEVKGWSQPDGSVNAAEVEGKRGNSAGRGVSRTKFYGVVNSMPAGMYGAWVIGGRTINVTPATRIEQDYGPIAVGSFVEVKGWSQPNGSVNATEVEGKRGNSAGRGVSRTKFYGVVNSMPAGMYGAWVISGRTVNVTATTRIEQDHGPIAVGSFVEVKGWSQPDGSVNATELESRRGNENGRGVFRAKFSGIVNSMPAGMYGAWVVSGRTVNVTPATKIEQEGGPIGVGAYVEVKGWSQPDGSVNASKIESWR